MPHLHRRASRRPVDLDRAQPGARRDRRRPRRAPFDRRRAPPIDTERRACRHRSLHDGRGRHAVKRPRIVARLIDLRAGESRIAILSFLVLMLTSAGYTVLETARDALLVTQLPQRDFGVVYIARRRLRSAGGRAPGPRRPPVGPAPRPRGAAAARGRRARSSTPALPIRGAWWSSRSTSRSGSSPRPCSRSSGCWSARR